MTRIRDAVSALTSRLSEAGIETARLDAELLLGHVLDADKTWLFNHAEESIDRVAENRLRDLADRRCRREPISLILGHREFWSLSFRVSEQTLTPRPDSETVIEAVLAQVTDREKFLSVLDLGTGTGCLLLALLSELRSARGLGVDKSSGALAIAQKNAKSLGLEDRSQFRQSDWFAGIDGKFDIVVANPPYIPSGEIAALDPEVARYEPRDALDGGEDGFDAYRCLAAAVPQYLRPNGLVAFEVGAGQAGFVAELLREAGLTLRQIRRDLSGIERCVLAGN